MDYFLKYSEQFDSYFSYDKETASKFPFTSPTALFLLMVFYLLSIQVLQFLMSFRSKGFNISSFTIVWNFLMFAMSLWMFVGFLQVVLTNFLSMPTSEGFYRCLCDPSALLSVGGDFWFYMFYLSKFIEFGDTYFLILKKKPVIFLHWYHHFVTASIIWTAWLYPVASGQWVGPMTNSFVHIFMYFYYFAQELFGVSRHIGSYVTQLQIAQFLYCLGMFFFVGVLFFGGQCQYGSMNAFLYLSYQYAVFLYLFLKMKNSRTKKLSQASSSSSSSSSATKRKHKKN